LRDDGAGKSSTKEVWSFDSSPVNPSDVFFIPLDLRPVLLQYLVAVRVVLYLPDDLHPGPLEPEVQATNA